MFVRDGFCDAVAALLEGGERKGSAVFERLLGLVEIRRPFYALIWNSGKDVTTHLRSFGLIHRIGPRPSAAPTLASRAEMRMDEGEGGELTEFLKPTPESGIVRQVLEDYVRIHPFAADRISFTAANVESLHPVIAGVDEFLRNILDGQGADEVPYSAYVRVIGIGPSPAAAQSLLRSFRRHWAEKKDRGRSCRLVVSYRSASKFPDLAEIIGSEREPCDVAMLFRFLGSQTGSDEISPTRAFRMDYGPISVSKFPICEHPRPISDANRRRRQSLVSNRRFHVATYHAELTARLKMPYHPEDNHLVFRQVEYGKPEEELVGKLHKIARWVACVDHFVDRNMLLQDAPDNDRRKLVGFSCGVGSYGELNLTLSTEAGTVRELVKAMAVKLGELFRKWSATDAEAAARVVVDQAQAVTGLSLVKALGQEAVKRDVVGYAIARRAWLRDAEVPFSVAVPLDSFRHWFDDADDPLIPDLLLLEADIQNGEMVIDATVVESKLGQAGMGHIEEATAQAASGLSHLTRLFLPNIEQDSTARFDRRYWWAQLHRVLVVRNVKTVPGTRKRETDGALERLTEGHFTIRWRAIAATFWTNTDEGPGEPIQTSIHVSTDGLPPHEGTPVVHHAAFGQHRVLDLLMGPEAGAARPDACISFRASIQSEEIAQEPSTGHVDVVAPAVPPAHEVQAGAAPVQAADSPSAHPLSAADTVGPAEISEQPEPPRMTAPSSLEPIHEPVIPTPKPERSDPSSERLLIGRDMDGRGGTEHIYWEYGNQQMPNRHLLVFGGSGSGKTYAIQCLLGEMARLGRRSLVVDYTDGFLPNHLEDELKRVAEPKTYALATGYKIPIDPFRLQHYVIEGLGPVEDKPFEVAKRVASTITSVYSTVGEQQRSALVAAIEQGVLRGAFSLEQLLDDLTDVEQEAMAAKIMPLARTAPFATGGKDSWEAIFRPEGPRLHILQLTRLDRDIQRLIVEFVLWDLWDFVQRTGHRDRPIPIVLDEVQNLDHSEGSPLSKFLREGRKFGASLILATQTMSNFKRDQRDQLFQAAHKLFFAPAATEVKGYADILRDSQPGTRTEDWVARLSGLKKGECLSVGHERRPNGSLVSTVRKVRILSMLERFSGSMEGVR